MSAEKDTKEILTSTRMTEIVYVLRKHEITKGMSPTKLREILEDLGPTYVKFGQIMSMRSDMLPISYCNELEKLRTDVMPLPFDVIKASIEEQLNEPLKEIFSSIDETPLGSASIAQVHRATLCNGDQVVIKVQRPHIYETMESDIKLLRKACKAMKLATGTGDLLDFRAVVEEIWQTSQVEMDFVKEAENIDRFAENQRHYALIVVPHVYHEYTSRKMLVMSYIDGIQVDNLEALRQEEYDLDQIAKETAQNYCKQILDDGFFHADPHPGNITITHGHIAWIDFGMMGTVTPDTQRKLKKAIQAIVDDDVYDLEEAFLLLVQAEDEINHAQLISQLGSILDQYKQKSFGEFNFGPLIEQLFKIVKTNRIAVPSDLTMLCRSMVTMEGTLGKVSPRVNLLEILANTMRLKLKDEIDFKTELLQAGHTLYTSTKKSAELPAMTFDIMKLLKNGHLNISTTQSMDEKMIKEKRQSNSNIVYALLIMSLFLSASLMTLSHIKPTIMGLPYLSFAGFILGLLLLIILLIRLHKQRK